MDRQLARFYRTAESYLRYVPSDLERRKELLSLYRRFRRFFGAKVLDLACGGGVLGWVLEPTGKTYVGIDVNPDMLREARRAARDRGSHQRFLQGDITTARIPGRFDTLTLLGNALGHLRVAEMEELLSRRTANIHVGSSFLIDYRDVVAMFWDRAWKRVYTQTHKRGKVVCRTRRVDFRKGSIYIDARPARGSWVVNYTQAIWSPFILEPLMKSHGWSLEFRSLGRPYVVGTRDPFSWVEVYRYRGN